LYALRRSQYTGDASIEFTVTRLKRDATREDQATAYHLSLIPTGVQYSCEWCAKCSYHFVACESMIFLCFYGENQTQGCHRKQHQPEGLPLHEAAEEVKTTHLTGQQAPEKSFRCQRLVLHCRFLTSLCNKTLRLSSKDTSNTRSLSLVRTGDILAM
jgi:hypothetical protein